MVCFSGCCCASCKDNHEKSIEAAKEWTSFSQSDYTCCLVIAIFFGPAVLWWAGMKHGKGCAQFCCLFIIMDIAAMFTGGILGLVWPIAWVMNLKEAGIIKE